MFRRLILFIYLTFNTKPSKSVYVNSSLLHFSNLLVFNFSFPTSILELLILILNFRHVYHPVGKISRRVCLVRYPDPKEPENGRAGFSNLSSQRSGGNHFYHSLK